MGYSECAGCEVERLTADYMAHERMIAGYVDELSRLRAVNAELRKILARALAEEKCGADGVFFTVATECTEGRCWHFQARAALSRAEQAKPETCVWNEMAVDGIDRYKTSCGTEFFELPMTYCGNCGKRVEVRG